MRRWNNPKHRSGIEFEERKVDLRPNHGKWSILTCHSDNETQPCDINLQTDPLARFNKKGYGATHIMSRLRLDTSVWLSPEAQGCVRISSSFYVTDDKLVSKGSSTYSEIVVDSLKVVFAYVKLAAWLHFRKSGTDHHLQWILHDADLPLLQSDEPHTTIHNALLGNDGYSVDALIRLMRIPTRFEGGTDFMFEKFVQVALKLLFEPNEVLFLECLDRAALETTTPILSLLISGASFEWDDNAQECFALHARSTLTKLVGLSSQKDSLPDYCVVYGIHCASDKLRIIAHFPLDVQSKDEGCWKFAQVVVAEHWISIEKLPQPQYLIFETVDDSATLNRWRMSAALFTLRYQIRHLKKTLGGIGFSISPPTGDASFLTDVTQDRTLAPPTTIYFTAVFEKLRSFWRSPKLSVPESWVPPEQVEIQLPKRDDQSWLYNAERHIPAMLLQLILHPLRHLLTPMKDQEIWDNHLSYAFQGPDFVHWVHIPRSRAEWEPPTESNLITEPHLNRCYDLMTMATRTWDEINVFIANVFANFTDYSVLWQPTAKYATEIGVEDEKRIVEIETIDYRHGNLVMDFALSVRPVAASTFFTIRRTPQLPLTCCSPAALVGLRSVDMAGNGSHISEDELQAIGDLLTAHSRPIRSALKVAGNQEENVPEWATVMCTFLKRGFVHLIACKPVLEGKVEVEVIDSLPVKTKVEELEELEDRMRLVIALFTLQRHVARFASHWCDIALPGDIMDDEHEAIVEVTGLSTPPVSDDEE